MSGYKIVEEYDGRLPIYNIILNEKVIKSFDSLEEASGYLKALIDEDDTTSYGEENPCC